MFSHIFFASEQQSSTSSVIGNAEDTWIRFRSISIRNGYSPTSLGEYQSAKLYTIENMTKKYALSLYLWQCL